MKWSNVDNKWPRFLRIVFLSNFLTACPSVHTNFKTTENEGKCNEKLDNCQHQSKVSRLRLSLIQSSDFILRLYLHTQFGLIKTSVSLKYYQKIFEPLYIFWISAPHVWLLLNFSIFEYQRSMFGSWSMSISFWTHMCHPLL